MKKKKIELHFTIDIPIYETYIRVIIGSKDFYIQEINNTYPPTHENYRKLIETSFTDCLGCTTLIGGSATLLYIQNAYDSNTVAHEIFHVVFAILTSKGLLCDISSEEAFAYLIGYVTEQFYLKIKESKKESK